MSRLLKISRERVYKIVEKTKQVLISSRLNSNSAELFGHKIKTFWEINDNTGYLIENIIKYLSYYSQQTNVPSSSWIIGYHKNTLKISYKRVSWRPMKNNQIELTCQRLETWSSTAMQLSLDIKLFRYRKTLCSVPPFV